MNLFFVHSHITLLASLSIIEEFKPCNPLLVIYRDYDFPQIEITSEKTFTPQWLEYLYLSPSYGTQNPVKDLVQMYRLDKWLQQITGNKKFTLYIPHSKSLIFQFLLTHRDCIELNYIDEGLLSYWPSFHKLSTAQFSIFRKLIYGRRINYFRARKVDYRYQNLFVKTMIKEKGENKVRWLNWPKVTYETSNELEGKVIIVLNNFDKFFLYNKCELRSFLNQFFSCYQNERLLIKFHPRDKKREIALEVLSDLNIDYELIADNVVLELLLLSNKVKGVTGIWSSLLFYASSMSIPVKSHINQFQEINSTTLEWIKSIIPDVFYKVRIEFI